MHSQAPESPNESLIEALENSQESNPSVSLSQGSPMRTLDVDRITDYPVCSSPESGICRSPSAGSRRSSISGISESSLTSDGSLTYDASRRPNKNILKKPHGPRRGSKNRVRWRLPGGDNESDTVSIESYDSSNTGSSIFQRARNGIMESRQNWREFERCPSPGSTGLTPARRPPGRTPYNMQGRATSPESPIYQSPKHIPTILISPSSSSENFGRSPSPFRSPPRVTSPSHSPVPPASAPSAVETRKMNGHVARMHSTPVSRNYSDSSLPRYYSLSGGDGRSGSPMDGYDDSSDVFAVSVLRFNSSTLSELDASTQDERRRGCLFEFPSESRQRARKLSAPSSFKSYALPENPLLHDNDSDDYDHLDPVDANGELEPNHEPTPGENQSKPLYEQRSKDGKTVSDRDKRLSGRYRTSDIDEALQQISEVAALPKESTPADDEMPPAIPPKRKIAQHHGRPLVNPPQRKSSPTESTAPVVPPKKRKSPGQFNSEAPATKSAQEPVASATARPTLFKIPVSRGKTSTGGNGGSQSQVLPKELQSSAPPMPPVNREKDTNSSSKEQSQAPLQGIQSSVPPVPFKIPVNRGRRRNHASSSSKEGAHSQKGKHKALPPVPEVDGGRNKPLPPLPEISAPGISTSQTASQSDGSIIPPPSPFASAPGPKLHPHTSHVRQSSTSSVDSLHSVSNSTLIAEPEESATPQSQKCEELQATSPRFLEEPEGATAIVHPDSPPERKTSWHVGNGMEIQDRVVVGAENPDDRSDTKNSVQFQGEPRSLHHESSLGSDSSSDERVASTTSTQTTAKPNQINPGTYYGQYSINNPQGRSNKPPNPPSPRFSKKMSMEMAYAEGNVLRNLRSAPPSQSAPGNSKQRSSSDETPGQRTTPEGEAQSQGLKRNARSSHPKHKLPLKAVRDHFPSQDQHLLQVLYSGGKLPNMKPVRHDTDKSINAMLAELEEFEDGGEQHTLAQQPCGTYICLVHRLSDSYVYATKSAIVSMLTVMFTLYLIRYLLCVWKIHCKCETPCDIREELFPFQVLLLYYMW